MRRRWWFVVLVLSFAWLLVGSDCNGPVRETSIVSFEVNPNPVVRGGSVVVAWQAEFVGVRDGGPYCTLQRTFEGQPAEALQVVLCLGSRTDTIGESETATYVNYRFSALRRSGQAYETADVRLGIVHVAVTVVPDSVTLEPGASQDFTATVTGVSDSRVTWAASCGSISGSGNTITYTAPSSQGVCEVTATSVASPDVSASASVTVGPETYDVALLFWPGAMAAVSPFVAGLEARGFDVEPVILGSSESMDASSLATYDLLLIDTFSGLLNSWTGDPTIVPTIVTAIEDSERPVVGLGEGGYAYFGTVGSPLGWPRGAHGSGLDSFVVVEPTHPSLMGPRNVEIAAGQVGVAAQGMAHVMIYVPDPVPPLQLVGRTGTNHYVVLIDGAGAGSAMWGFHGMPSGYTDDGWNALANLMNYLISAL
jgi:hypothetical protein